MKYQNLYQRNIGIFTNEEQNKLKNAHVFIAGMGGVGGIQAVTLARMGIGGITLMDPGIYDEPDMNRQYGAMVNTIGKSKAVVMGDLLTNIAPHATIEVYDKKLDESTLRKEIKKSEKVVINAIDLVDFRYKVMFAKIAREENKYHLFCPIPDLGAILMIFNPNGITFEEFTNEKRFPPMTNIAKEKYKNNILDNDKIPFLSSISTNSGAAALSGGLLAIEAALIITGKRKKEDIISVPNVTHVDFLSRSFRSFNPFDDL